MTAQQATVSPLRLFWWNGQPNFGDRIGQNIVAHLSGRTVEWSSAIDCELFAVGSLMKFVRRAFSVPRQTPKPIIWGTGAIGPVRLDFRANVDFAAVRGPLTETLLEVSVGTYGDPGLFAADLPGMEIEREDKFGIVLHHTQKLDASLAKALEKDGRFLMIDVANPDHHAVVRQIGSCRHVISSSLHGLIVADSFGVPNSWLSPVGIHGTSRIKFYDYALSVSRVLNDPLRFDQIREFSDRIQPGPLHYRNEIEQTKTRLLECFPDALRGGAR